jgi:hypothetical protein
MTRHWSVRRHGVPRREGARRWDDAYQHLLQWTQATQSAQEEAI